MLIEAKNIRKSYLVAKKNYEVLKGIDLSLSSGIHVLQGPSGSGKSTLLNILGTIDKKTSGTLNILGHDIDNSTNKDLEKLRFNSIGFIFQQFNLIPVLSAYENIEYPLLYTNLSKKQRKEKILTLTTELGITEFINKKPKQLSGGQQQRVAIARSVVHCPKILIADEPTASLDSENVSVIINLIKRIVEEQKIVAIIATHDSRVAQMCNNIIKLSDGVLV